MSNFDETLMKRLTKLEREVERLRVKERPVGGGGGVTDHGALGGLSDNDHPQYLLTTGKASDSDKLDGVDSTGFVNTTGTQTVDGTKTFSSIPVLPASNPTTANQAVRKGYADGAYLGINGKAADSDKLDGIDSTGFATAGHDHNAAYLGITAKAADSDKLDGLDSTAFLQTSSWTDWTPTVTGWAAGYTVKLARYQLIGKTCFFTLDISGTSNSTAVTIALPHQSATGNFDGYWGGSCAFFQDNGTSATAPGRWYVGETSATLVAHTNMAYGTWTATGTKRVLVTGFYEIA